MIEGTQQQVPPALGVSRTTTTPADSLVGRGGMARIISVPDPLSQARPGPVGDYAAAWYSSTPATA